MSLSNAVIDALLGAGCTAEQLAAAMKAANAANEERREAKRANNAERQRRYRERHSNKVTDSNALQDVTERDSVTSPSLSLPPNENISNPPTHTHPDTTPRARKADQFPCPEGVDPVDWEGLKANRRAQKAPFTEAAHRGITRKLDAWQREGWPPGPIVANAAEKGWRTVFETDEMKGRANGQRQCHTNQRETTGETAYRIAAELAGSAGTAATGTYR